MRNLADSFKETADFGVTAFRKLSAVCLIAIARIKKSYYGLSMQIQVKLFATYREYLPPECTRGVQEMEAPKGATAVSVLTQLGVPTDGESVMLVNGRSPEPDQLLQEGDVVCAFPAIAGG